MPIGGGHFDEAERLARVICGETNMDAESDGQWITTESGSHVLLNSEGEVTGGAGGKMNGRKLSNAKSTSSAKSSSPSKTESSSGKSTSSAAKSSGKKSGSSSKAKKATITYTTGSGRTYSQSGTLEELTEAYSYTLQKGKSWENEPGNKKVNTHPKTIKQLVKSLENAEYNTGSGSSYYSMSED